MNSSTMFVTDGDAYFTLQYNGDILDTATGLDSWLLNPHTEYPNYCYFNQAQNAGLVDGVTLTGQTSGAVIKVGRVVLTGGAVASAGAGVLFFQKISGTISTGENLRVSTTTYAVAASGMLDSPVGCQARAMLLQAETNAIRLAMGDVNPTNAAATPASFGVIINSGESTNISGAKNISSLKIIHAASGSNAAVNMVIYF